MGSKEIKITEYEVENCEGNLNSLISQWEGAPKVDAGIFMESSGRSEESLKSALEVTAQVNTSMDQLLASTLAFCKNMGVTFKESDAAAGKNIDSITARA